MSTAVSKPDNKVNAQEAPPTPPKTIRDMLLQPSFQKQLANALGSLHLAERLARVVLTAMQKNPDLQKCTMESMWECCLHCASLNLMPDPLGRIYLVPFKDHKKNITIATVVVGYQGFIELAYRSGQIDSIQLRPVFKGDEFSYSFGMEPSLKHVPCDNPGEMTHVYSVVKVKGADTPSFDVMSRQDVERVRARSKARDNGPWQTDYVPMALKTVFRRHRKLLPQSVDQVAAAEIDHDAPDLALLPEPSAMPARLTDNFTGKTLEGSVELPEALSAALTKAHAAGMTVTAIVAELIKAGAAGDTVEACAASLPADKVQRAVDLLEVASRATAEG
jgi:recombination protein RecT